MLYDKKWDKQIEVDPYSLESFIAWAEKQPKNKVYFFWNSTSCLAAQWLKATGAPEFDLKMPRLEKLFGGQGSFVFLAPPHTIGAALKRARKLAAQA